MGRRKIDPASASTSAAQPLASVAGAAGTRALRRRTDEADAQARRVMRPARAPDVKIGVERPRPTIRRSRSRRAVTASQIDCDVLAGTKCDAGVPLPRDAGAGPKRFPLPRKTGWSSPSPDRPALVTTTIRITFGYREVWEAPSPPRRGFGAARKVALGGPEHVRLRPPARAARARPRSDVLERELQAPRGPP